MSEPIKHIPFSPETSVAVNTLNNVMIAIAVVHFIIGGLSLLCCPCTVCGLASTGANTVTTGNLVAIQEAFRQISGSVIGLLLFGQAFLLLSARGALNEVINSDEDDQTFLANGLDKLKIFFIAEVFIGLLLLASTVINGVLGLVAKF